MIVTIEEERYYWQLIGRNAARHPTILRTSPTTRNSLAKTLIVLKAEKHQGKSYVAKDDTRISRWIEYFLNLKEETTFFLADAADKELSPRISVQWLM